MPKIEIIWRAPEFEYQEKGVSWYWLSIILAVTFLSAAVWQKNFLFGLFIIIGEIVILTWAGRQPNLIEFKLNDKGLTIAGQKFYAYHDIESFSLDENYSGEWIDLIVHFRHNWRRILKIKIPKEKLAEIEKAFVSSVPKVEFEETFLDALEKFLRF